MNRKSALLTICLSLCAALLLCGLGGLTAKTTAWAEGTLQVTGLTVTPGSLPASGGTVTLSGTLENTTGADINSVLLEVGTYQLEINDTIANGGTHAFTMEDVPVASTDLGVQLTLSITWPEGNNTATFTVPVQTQTVDLSFKRTINNKSVQKGDSVKLTYNLKNNGTAIITDLKLTDSCVDGIILSGLTLNPGDSKQVTSTITVTAETTSVPKVEYTANAVTNTKTLESSTITIANASLSVTATADKTEINAGDTVVFTITIQNDSAVAVNGIKVTDDLENIIRSSSNIAATTGSTPKTLAITYEAEMTTGRSVSFSITYQSGSQTAVKTSDAILIIVNGLIPGVSPLTMTVSASPVAMTFPGEVTFTITVQNTSGQAISGIGIKEASLGDMGSLVTLAPGGQQTLTKTANVAAAATFIFTATGTDTTGNAIEPATTQVVVTNQVGTATPEVVNPSGSDTLSTLFVVMIVIIVLIVLAGITLIVLMIQEKRNKGNGPKGGGPSRRRNRKDKDRDDEDPLAFATDNEGLPHASREDRTSRRISAMEHTQPILRSGLTASGLDTPLRGAGRRRAYSLNDEEDSWTPRRDDSIVEEEESAVFGPAAFLEDGADKTQLHREPLDSAMRRTPVGRENNRPPGSQFPNGQQEDADPLYDEDRNLRTRRRSPAVKPDEEKPPVHLRYENQDDDLPPLRPRRRR